MRATENAGLELNGPIKFGGGVENKDWKMTDEIARVENTGLENGGPIHRTGKFGLYRKD